MNDEKGKAMKISNDLRLWCDDADADNIACDDLRELADRVDNEMVELPKDADGEVIHVGDTLYDRASDQKIHVEALRFDGLWEIRTVLGYVMPRWYVHERPDSFERIADDLDKWCDGADVDGDACGKQREFAERICKLAKEGE